MKLPIITTLTLVLFFLGFTFVEAEIFQWKDDTGIIHYSSTPPKPTEKISHLKGNIRFTDNKAMAYKNHQKAKSSPEKDNKKDIRSKKRKKRNYCNGQRRSLLLLKTKIRHQKKGKSTTLSSKQRKNKIRSLKESIRSRCSSENSKKHFDDDLFDKTD